MPRVQVYEIAGWIIAALILLAAMVVSYLFVALLVWIICLAFGFEWSWMLSLGVFAFIVLLQFILSAAKSSLK